MNGLPDWTDGVPRLAVESCPCCGRRWYFRRGRCPACGASGVRRSESRGSGMVAAVTALHHGPGERFGVCLVDLDEGVRVMARCDPDLRPGTPVTVRIADGLPHAESG